MINQEQIEVHPFTCCLPALATNCERKNGTGEGILDKNMDCPCGFVKNNKDTVSGPQWRTGPIPNPTGPSILLLETNNETPTVYITTMALGYWPKSGHAFSAVKMIEFFEKDYTGRWFIQPINLPKS